MHIDEIDTPAVLIDMDRVEANLKRAQDYADAHGLPRIGATPALAEMSWRFHRP